MAHAHARTRGGFGAGAGAGTLNYQDLKAWLANAAGFERWFARGFARRSKREFVCGSKRRSKREFEYKRELECRSR